MLHKHFKIFLLVGEAMKQVYVLPLIFALVLTSTAFAAGPPTNDLCAQAIPIGLGDVTGSTIGAGAEGKSTCDADLSPDVWYRYDGPVSEDGLSIDTIGSSFDTVVSIHARCPENAPGRSFDCPFLSCFEVDSSLICNDDAFEEASAVLTPQWIPPSFLIRVTGKSPAERGDFRLRVAEPAALVGRVVDRETGQPVQNGEVIIAPQDIARTNRVADTLDNGRFAVYPLPSGRYRVSVRKADPFLGQIYDDQPCLRSYPRAHIDCFPEVGTELEIRAGEEIQQIRFELDQAARIAGQVLDQETGEPIPNATLTAHLITGYTQETVADSEGRYEFQGLIGGEYRISVAVASHRDAVFPGLSCGLLGCSGEDIAAGQALIVAEGRPVVGIDPQLERLGGVSGRITDAEGGTPVTDASVAIFKGRDLVATVQVDENGDYSLGGLDPDAYQMVVRSLSHRSELYLDKPCDYPTTAPSCNWQNSDPINVPSLRVVQDVNFALERFGTISGRVIDEDTGQGLSNISLIFFGPRRTFQLTTDADGHYLATGAFPGDYRGRVRNAAPYVNELFGGIPCINISCPIDLSERIQVAFGQDVDEVDFHLGLGGTITGSVRDAVTGAPIPFSALSILPEGGHNLGHRFGVDTDGQFTATGLFPGQNFAVASSFFHQPQIYDGIPCDPFLCDTVVTGTAIPVVGGEISSNVDFHLLPNTGISGTVRSPSGAPLVDVTVFAYERNSGYAQGGFTDEHGVYTITPLGPGDYFLVAGGGSRSSLPPILWPDIQCPADGCDLSAADSPVTVQADGFTRDIDFTMTASARITGRVTEDDTGIPLAGVRIDAWRNVFDQLEWYAGHTLSGPDGRYALEVTPGHYFVSTDNGRLGGTNELFDNIPCPEGSALNGGCAPFEGEQVTAAMDAPGVADFALEVGATCVPDDTTLCLGEDGRFRVDVEWSTGRAAPRPAQAVELTRDTGYFWFFNADNVEMVVKVLDACPLTSNRLWVFAGGLTDVATSLHVVDTWTGVERSYSTQAGQPFQPILDTNAFDTCEAARGVSNTVRKAANPTPEPKAIFCTGELCLNNDRFEVEAIWNAPDGSGGSAEGVALTNDSGYFWFFNDDNIELVVKVLDGCAEPQNTYWVFAAGLTDVEVTLRVLDRNTGEVREYVNPQGTPFQPILDTQAFATCS